MDKDPICTLHVAIGYAALEMTRYCAVAYWADVDDNSYRAFRAITMARRALGKANKAFTEFDAAIAADLNAAAAYDAAMTPASEPDAAQ